MSAFIAAPAVLFGGRSVLRTCSRRAPPRMIRGFPNARGAAGSGDAGAPRRETVFDLLAFPTVFTFKVIGERQGDFVNDIVDSVALALETEKKFLKTSFRDRGKYRSITIDVPVNTSEQIYTVYEAIDRDPRVKYKF